MDRSQAWLEARKYTPEMLAPGAPDPGRGAPRARHVSAAVERNPLPGGGYLGKHVLVAAYRQLTESGEWQPTRLCWRASA